MKRYKRKTKAFVIRKVWLTLYLSLYLACFIASFVRRFRFRFTESLTFSFAIGRTESKGTDHAVSFFE